MKGTVGNGVLLFARLRANYKARCTIDDDVDIW